MTARTLLAAHGVLGLVSVLAVSRDALVALFAARHSSASDAAWNDVPIDPHEVDPGDRRTVALRGFRWLAPAAVLTQFAVGLALYPAYRVRVRALDFDRNAPLYSQLFDFKEHLAALSLALIVAMAVATRRPARGRDARWPLAFVSATAAVLIWTVAILGVCVTARHAV